MVVSSSTNPPPPPPIRPQRVRSRSRSSSHRKHSNSCNDLQQQNQRNDNSSPPSQMLSSRISSPTNTSSSSSSGKRRWKNPFARSNSTGTGQSPSPIYNRPNLSQSQHRPNNSRGRPAQQGRSRTAPGNVSQGMPSPPFSHDNNSNQGNRSGSAPTSHSTRNEKMNTSCAQNNNTSRSSSRGRLQRPTSDRRLANRTTKHSRSPPPLERRAVYQPVCNSGQRGNIAKHSTTQNVQQQQSHSNNIPTRQQQQQNHDRRSYDLNSDLVNSIREIYHIIPAPPPPQQQQNASQNNEIGIRSQPPPPPPIRNQSKKQQAPPPPPRVSSNNLSEFVMYTPEEFERVAAATAATAGQQNLMKYPPPPPKQAQQLGSNEGNRRPARRRGRSNEFGLSSSLVKRLSEEEGNVNTSIQQLLDISESTREGLPFDILPTAMKQDGKGPSVSGQTYRRTKSQDNVSSSHIMVQGQKDEYDKSNMTFNLGEVRDALDQMKRNDNDPGQDGEGERRMSFMTKTRRQLSHAQKVIALVANPASSSSNASKSTTRSGSKSASQNDIEHHQKQQKDYQDEEEKQHLGFRHDYNLGDTARSSSHMIIETDAQRAIESIGTLSSHDFAFVKRSDGTYSYSILAYRSSSTHVDEESLITRPPQLQGEEESMTFVLSNAGCTKLIRKSQWSQCIRLVAPEEEEDCTAQSLPVTILQPDKIATAAKEADDEEVREVQSNPDVEIYLKKIRDQTYNTTQEEKKQPLLPGEPGWTPPDTLAFNTYMDDDLISCISTPMGLARDTDDGQDKKIAISTQPVIEE